MSTPQQPGPPAARTGPKYTKNEPLLTRLIENVQLNAVGSSKEVRQFSFAVPEDFGYEVGDSLGVWAKNSDAAVLDWLAATRLDGDEPVRLDGLGEVSLRDAARDRLEIVKVTPDLLRFVADRTRSRELATLLRPDNKTDLQRWLHGRQAMDVIAEHPVRASVEEWLGVVKRLQPRQYSISSSPKVDPTQVSLTVSTVRFEHQGKARHGVCSTFLADRCGVDQVPVFLNRSASFKPPADGTRPMIMVGPGTGIAPFRAFLHERRALGHTGRNWLFFGERTSGSDFYYREELEEMRASGFLTRLSLAFSRDQREKVYVQDRMRQYGADLWAWLEDGASFFVCGDASRMAKDVDQALRDVVERHGQLSAEEAATYVKKLSAEKRYVRDVY